ncbi:hypothetical protein FN846DRAFT_1000013 [Sphaerosporella brunnea]|uniref:Protein kinase domain-containing protein n=1 Tax=Sphaerosporella brunnea TaxID=1250544 RepID=A0A5J5EI25_9PEZI|nr:hypothetical protein FN846DRAFT_1000013 [Sphaerosporella brunnea]
MPSEVSEAIDVWALGCTIYHLFGDGYPFTGDWGILSGYLGDVVRTLGGRANVPERFWGALSEYGAFTRAEAPVPHDWPVTWHQKMLLIRGDSEEGTAAPLDHGDDEIVRRIVDAALVFDPACRANASTLATMIPCEWDSEGETMSLPAE